jgi:hypothetical protein
LGCFDKEKEGFGLDAQLNPRTLKGPIGEPLLSQKRAKAIWWWLILTAMNKPASPGSLRYPKMPCKNKTKNIKKGGNPSFIASYCHKFRDDNLENLND